MITLTEKGVLPYFKSIPQLCINHLCLGVSPRSEDETPRECETPPLGLTRPSSLGPNWWDLQFHCAFGFSVYPTTRSHVKLLGLYFKTGRISTLNCRRRPVLQDPSEDAARQEPRRARSGPESVITRRAPTPASLTFFRSARYPKVRGGALARMRRQGLPPGLSTIA